ncbi:unnamed protein product [Phytophthora fragariaefolia]|uniref:Unnamed protein product n=1 Tax=Phytophthora fragariaefolia TaxID=1490495 RepID=A0A9W7CWI4_9STRA|nr:unnamed protein product [Phytophthora fragariaefolia]
MARWLSFFAEYNFTVEYKPGKQNVLADALSRRPDYELAHLAYLASPLYELIREAYATDDDLAGRLSALASPDKAVNLTARQRDRLHRYSVVEGLLYYQVDRDKESRIVVPNDEDLRHRILYSLNGFCHSYSGVRKGKYNPIVVPRRVLRFRDVQSMRFTTAQDVAEVYEECVFWRFGSSSMFTHDQDPRFISEVFTRSQELLGSKQGATFAYRQQERSVQTLVRGIRRIDLMFPEEGPSFGGRLLPLARSTHSFT